MVPRSGLGPGLTPLHAVAALEVSGGRQGPEGMNATAGVEKKKIKGIKDATRTDPFVCVVGEQSTRERGRRRIDFAHKNRPLAVAAGGGGVCDLPDPKTVVTISQDTQGKAQQMEEN
jgi:hypothetical protein